MSCKNSPGSFKGAYYDKDTGNMVGVSGQLPCNCWKCSDCASVKAKVVRKRIFKGLVSKVDPSDKHSVKLLTLTCPGREFRETYTPSQAHDMMSLAYHQIRTLLVREYGEFHYFKVTELQKDGFPHIHVLMVGKNIAPKGIRQRIAYLWQDVYGLGFISLKSINNVKHGVNYLTKYLTKGLISVRKYARVFSSSRYALAKFAQVKPPWLDVRFFVGRAMPNSSIEIPLEEVEDITTNRILHRLLSPVPF